jgi:histidine triad (HIT) family protein
MENCLFCKIVNKQINSEIVYENDDVLVFKDLYPKAPVHLLVIPKKHISSIIEIEELNDKQANEILKTIAKIAKEMGLDRDGFRVVTNTGAAAGQSVDHLHFHLLGKRSFNWPPG